MQLSGNTKGALLMVGSMAAFTLNDTFMKELAGQVHLFQLLVLRGALSILFVGLLTWKMGAMHLRIPRRDRVLIVLRMIGEIGAAYFFLTALFNMPLANVTAILQSLPLAVSLCAAMLFNEPLGWRRFSAIMVGMIGVLLILQPGGTGFNSYALYALIAVGFVVLRDLATRRLSGAAHSMMVTFATTVAVTAFFSVASLTVDWVPLDGRALWLVLKAAVMVTVGYLLSVLVMRVGEVSFIAPFRYTGLIWALGLGWYVFGDWPQPVVLLGAGIVVGSGLFMLYREALLARRKEGK